jgi:hypothetical protein
MIQRIQSVYLFLTTLMSILFLNGSFINFINKTGVITKLTFKGIEEGSSAQGFTLIESLLPLSIVLLLIGAISLIAIFFFKKRTVQLWLSGILIGLASFLILACSHSSYLIITKRSAEIVPGFKMALPFLMLIFSILAYRGIRKDENLVKSYDRLR